MAKPTKSQRGYPAADRANPRNRRVQVLVSERDLAEIDKRRNGVSRSSYLYGLLAAALGPRR